MKTAPLLSIGMIFKNEIRCLERCLRSLQPLRNAIPCELIMADTGSDDGSREIAERYADLVFDFAWCDDFSAARNAVMDRCSGKWYFSIDCDEWLDADVSELAAFVKDRKKADFAFVNLRNYRSAELEKSDFYSDFSALRLVRMATGHRYHKAVHESWLYYEPVERLTHTLLYHDGYLYQDPEAYRKKMRRNMTLLRQELKRQPDDLLILNQCIESGSEDPDRMQYVRRAVKLVQEKGAGWEIYGGCILRNAIEMARQREMPELEEWIELAKKQCPDSVFVRVDVNFSAFFAAHSAKEWEKALRYAEAYQDGMRSAQSKSTAFKKARDLSAGSLQNDNAISERTLLIGLADACIHLGQAEKALHTLAQLPGEKLEPGQVRNATIGLTQLHAQSTQDVTPVLAAFYEQLGREEPDRQRKTARLSSFDATAMAAFTKNCQKEEREHDGWHRPAYTAFRCLAEQCEAGRAAAIMMTDDPAEMRAWLLAVEDWQALPIEALEHALQAGVVFPLGERPMPIEALDGLAVRLTHNDNPARQMTLAVSENEEYSCPQRLFWAQSLALASLRGFDWTLGKNAAPVSEFACPEKKKEPDERPKDTPETGLALIRRFARIESAVLPLLYAPGMLCEENAAMLPPMHRWGLTCSLAFEALDAGKPQEYLSLLRKGLVACPGQKEIVQFLLDRFQEDIRPKASSELLALAERVRMILSAYDPGDPAIAALKASPAYRQVAWIIEGPGTRGLPS